LEGKKQKVELSASAKAELNQVLKKLTDLGIEGGVRYQTDSFQGVLQEQLAGLLQDRNSCRYKVWTDLRDRMLPSAKPAAAPIAPKPAAKATSKPKAAASSEPPPATKPKPQVSANALLRVPFETPLDQVGKFGSDIETKDGGKRVSYKHNFAGDNYAVSQDVRDGRTSNASLWRDVTYQTYGPGRSTEGNQNDVRLACAAESIDELMERLKKRLGQEAQRTKPRSSQFSESAGNCQWAGTRTDTVASWRFDDGARAILHIEYELARQQNCSVSSGNDFRQHVCTIKICAVAPKQQPCFRVPGIDLD
jgi:hypothetical protein